MRGEVNLGTGQAFFKSIASVQRFCLAKLTAAQRIFVFGFLVFLDLKECACFLFPVALWLND